MIATQRLDRSYGHFLNTDISAGNPGSKQKPLPIINVKVDLRLTYTQLSITHFTTDTFDWIADLLEELVQ